MDCCPICGTRTADNPEQCPECGAPLAPNRLEPEEAVFDPACSAFAFPSPSL